VARFLVEDGFAIESRLLYVFAGQVLEGLVCAGMEIRLPRDSAAGIVLVPSVELGNRGSTGFVGLTCKLPGRDGLEAMARLDVNEQVIEVVEASPAALGR